MNNLLWNRILPFLSREKAFEKLFQLALSQKYTTTHGLDGCLASFFGYYFHFNQKIPLLVVTPTEVEAQSFQQDWQALGGWCELFLGWGGLIYQDVAPHARFFGQRSHTLAALRVGLNCVVTPLRGFLSRLVPPNDFYQLCITLQRGRGINPQTIAQKLSGAGYERTPRVSVPGEFALRGEVLDVYPAGFEEALRIVFEFDTVEQIRYFDPVSQNSGDSLESVTIPPMREWLFTEQQKLELLTELDEHAQELLAETGRFRNEELYFARSSQVSLLDYFPQPPLVIWLGWEKIENAERGFFRELETAWEAARNENRPRPRPDEVYFSLSQFGGVWSVVNSQLGEAQVNFRSYPRQWNGEVNRFLEDAQSWLEQGGTVFVFAESTQQRERLGQLFKDERIQVFDQALSGGFELEESKLLGVHESEIFGRKRRRLESLRQLHTKAIDSFVDLSPGDYVVHVNYGVGRFKGIDRLKTGGLERDYIKLEYAGDETMFIPIEQVNLVQRYIGNEGREPKLDSLGGKSWEKKKAKVKKSVEDLADRLIGLYARRKVAVGYSFPKDNEWQLSFEADFPFEETEDQLAAIREIKADMESSRPMDRLLCGDVGFGKTEVALRAAFKAITGGKQVAFLAPTTILAEQHYETCLERFARFPVTIRMLSRLVDRADQKKTLEELAQGKVDLVVGTHRLLQNDVKFKNLGLLIVDEEQRFGVKDKEKLKELRTSIDSLAMSATPIPRTLHMSLLRIRDMSLLRTPPRNRHPIETIIEEFNPEIIRKAIQREVDRGGQVFYLHNRIEGLEEICVFLRDLLPTVLVDFAHGQMSPHLLEDIMHRFIHGSLQVLVSTTIIENGIDIPNVNTIIIDRADMYGISQLYQLRGRVGRSGRVAYAYLLYPQKRALTELALKRLQVIGDFTELGSGFKIAMKDLEVRGAGNLLGSEQSGEIASVGFDMYLRLLDEAVSERLGEEVEDRVETVLELEYSGFIPDSYVAEPMEKMEVYKAIASVTEADDLQRVRDFIEDRFGPMPESVQSLLALAELKLAAGRLKIISLREKAGWCRLEFQNVSALPFDRVMKLIQRDPQLIRAIPEDPRVLVVKTGNVALTEKSRFLQQILRELEGGT